MNVSSRMALYDEISRLDDASPIRAPKLEWVCLAAAGNLREKGWGSLLFAPLPGEPPKQDLIKRLPDDEKLLSSLHYVLSIMPRFVHDGKVYVRRLDDEMEVLRSSIRPVWLDVDGGQRQMLGYHFPEEGLDLDRLIEAGPEVAQDVMGRIAVNLLKGQPLPKDVRRFAAAFLLGYRKLPSRPVARPSLAHRDAVLVAVTNKLCDLTGYDKGWGKSTFDIGGKIPTKACTIAAAALHAFGIEVRPQTANRIALEKSKKVGEIPPAMLRAPSSSDLARDRILATMSDARRTTMEKALRYLASPFN
jgi:hypothetical protein